MRKINFYLDFLNQLSEVNLTLEEIIFAFALMIIYYFFKCVKSIINNKRFFCKKDKNGFRWGVRPPKK